MPTPRKGQNPSCKTLAADVPCFCTVQERKAANLAQNEVEHLKSDLSTLEHDVEEKVRCGSAIPMAPRFAP